MTAGRPSFLPRFGKIDLPAGIMTAMLVPVMIVAHEMGHFLIGIAVNVPNPEIGLSGFRHGPAPWLSARKAAAIGLAGPAVTIAIAIAGLTLAKSGSRFASAMCVAACMRLCEILPFALLALLQWTIRAPARRTTFDEARVFDIFGLNGDVGLVMTSLVLGAILFALLRRHTVNAATSLIVGGLIGWAMWRLLLETGIIS